MNTYLYEQADRKHRTGQKLNEAEWEALLAGEREKREAEIDRAVSDAIDEYEAEAERG